jgi:hypothetical protein
VIVDVVVDGDVVRPFSVGSRHSSPSPSPSTTTSTNCPSLVHRVGVDVVVDGDGDVVRPVFAGSRHFVAVAVNDHVNVNVNEPRNGHLRQ